MHAGFFYIWLMTKYHICSLIFLFYEILKDYIQYFLTFTQHIKSFMFPQFITVLCFQSKNSTCDPSSAYFPLMMFPNTKQTLNCDFSNIISKRPANFLSSSVPSGSVLLLCLHVPDYQTEPLSLIQHSSHRILFIKTLWQSHLKYMVVMESISSAGAGIDLIHFRRQFGLGPQRELHKAIWSWLIRNGV